MLIITVRRNVWTDLEKLFSTAVSYQHDSWTVRLWLTSVLRLTLVQGTWMHATWCTKFTSPISKHSEVENNALHPTKLWASRDTLLQCFLGDVVPLHKSVCFLWPHFYCVWWSLFWLRSRSIIPWCGIERQPVSPSSMASRKSVH